MEDRTWRRAAAGLAAAVVLCAGLPSLARAAAPGRTAGGGARPADRRPVCVRGTCFDAEIAVTADERSRGLMYRDALAARAGMLFVFPEEGRHSFWMKNTRIELDMVFVGADLRVADVVRRAQPCRAEPCPLYTPRADAAYVLEIAGGLAEKLGIAAGDRVEFREPTPSRPPASGTR